MNYQVEMPALLVLGRHGLSLSNTLRREIFVETGMDAQALAGYSDRRIPLVPDGVKQWEIRGAWLRETFGCFDVVIDSGYERTVQSRITALGAYTAAERASMELWSTDEIREREPGWGFSYTREQMAAAFPWFQAHLDAVGYFDATVPGGESHQQVVDRVRNFIRHELPRYAGKRVMIFSHGGTMRAFRYVLERWDAVRYNQEVASSPIANAGIVVYRSSHSGLVLDSLHCEALALC